VQKKLLRLEADKKGGTRSMKRRFIWSFTGCRSSISTNRSEPQAQLISPNTTHSSVRYYVVLFLRPLRIRQVWPELAVWDTATWSLGSWITLDEGGFIGDRLVLFGAWTVLRLETYMLLFHDDVARVLFRIYSGNLITLTLMW